jgi:uncharacterized protein (DUF305 family)
MSKLSLSIPSSPLSSFSYLMYGVKTMIKQQQEEINRIERKLKNLTSNGKRKQALVKEKKNKRRKNKRKLAVKQRLKEERDLTFIRWIMSSSM